MGERGLFAPALLVARPALTGIVPLTHLIVGTPSCESTQRGTRQIELSGVPHSGQQSERQAARVTPPAWGEGKTEDKAGRQGLASFLRVLILYSDAAPTRLVDGNAMRCSVKADACRWCDVHTPRVRTTKEET